MTHVNSSWKSVHVHPCPPVWAKKSFLPWYRGLPPMGIGKVPHSSGCSKYWAFSQPQQIGAKCFLSGSLIHFPLGKYMNSKVVVLPTTSSLLVLFDVPSSLLLLLDVLPSKACCSLYVCHSCPPDLMGIFRLLRWYTPTSAMRNWTMVRSKGGTRRHEGARRLKFVRRYRRLLHR